MAKGRSTPSQGSWGRTAVHGMATNGDFFYRPAVRIDNSGLPGTHQKHWAEVEFTECGNELMTSYASAINVLSALSVASPRDLGYLTTDDQAEPFSYAAFAPSVAHGGARVRRREKVVDVPLVIIDGGGRIRMAR